VCDYTLYCFSNVVDFELLHTERFSAIAPAFQSHMETDALPDLFRDPAKVTLEIAKETFSEYQSASVRFTSHAEILFIFMGDALSRLKVLLEIATEDEDIFGRLDAIDNQGPTRHRPFFHGLGVDLQTLCTYLRSANPTSGVVNQVDVNVYVEILNRYGEVMTAVWKRSKEYALAVHSPIWLTISPVNIYNPNCDSSITHSPQRTLTLLV
jgi:hypothetical protein